ncbi:unnamed protein product [Penicillium nalgiovense]|nr:unnamed protein product [Penicillium nalgiovense]
MVRRQTPDIDGLCHDYTSRRHKYEKKANEESFRCREDWKQYIGPIERWGNCNPYEGHFASVVLPLCKPERLELVSYILECEQTHFLLYLSLKHSTANQHIKFKDAFPYGNVLESVSKALLDAGSDNLVLSDTEYRTIRPKTGTKQILSKMLLELLSIDKPCAEVVIQSWKEMVATTASRDKCNIFDNIEDYVEYRIIDTGAPFVDAIRRFGMGITLTPEEEETIAPIVRPCFGALGLANDYYSFDIEWEEFQKTYRADSSHTMTNAVWLYMNWEKLSIDEAKSRVVQVVRGYEKEFQRSANGFIVDTNRCGSHLREYLRSLAFQIPGNIVWRLRCPRYHPELCFDATKLLSTEADQNQLLPASTCPYEYISSLPSKGFREAFFDVLNVWLALRESTLKIIKTISQKLHSASLILDDIEDSSPLRRGSPATHTIFGPASIINSANWILIDVVGEVQELQSFQCMKIVIEELHNLFVGQSFDFAISLDFVILIGQHFQIRDDYMNLVDDEYTSGKGFSEDLDEGEFSFPIVHAWHSSPDLVMRGMIQEGKTSGSLSIPYKKTILERLYNTGRMEYTLQTSKEFQVRIYDNLEYAEKQVGCENWVMR